MKLFALDLSYLQAEFASILKIEAIVDVKHIFFDLLLMVGFGCIHFEWGRIIEKQTSWI